MKVIDTHIHFWDLANNINSWVNRSNNPSLSKNYLPNRVIKEFNENLYGVIHVEAHDSAIPTIKEVNWLNTVMENIPGLNYKHIVFADITLSNSQFKKLIDQFKEYEQIVGIRHILSHNSEFDYNPCEIDLSDNPNIYDNLDYLAKNNFIFDCQMYPYQLNKILPAIIDSNVTCVIDHLALPAWLKKNDINNQIWQATIVKLSKLSNVFLKVSGIDMFRKEPEFKEVIQFCLDSFPINRLMYGSNYPVSFNDDYNYWFNFLNSFNLSLEEKENLFFANAYSLFFKNK